MGGASGKQREKGVQGNWSLLWVGSPLGSCVSPGAAFLTEFRCIFSTESAGFALTLSVLAGGAAVFFFFF